MLRKINAVLSLIATYLLLAHAIFHALWMLSNGSIKITADNLPWILFGTMMVHAIISIAFAIIGNKGVEKRKRNGYSKMNVQTIIQRVGGILLLVFTILHVLGAIGVLQPPKVINAIFLPLFFALSLMHVAVSGSKAFITLGIGNAKVVKVIDIVIKILCLATLIACVVGFYLYIS